MRVLPILLRLEEEVGDAYFTIIATSYVSVLNNDKKNLLLYSHFVRVHPFPKDPLVEN